MNFKEVKELIEIVNNSNLTVFEVTIDNATVKMSKNSGTEFKATEIVPQKTVAETVQIAQVKEVAEEVEKEAEIVGNTVKAPIVGTFYGSPAPDKDDFVKVGDSVKKGDVLCIVEAMKVMNEVVSEFDGVVKKILVENEKLVEYGQPLMIIG